MHAHIVLQKPIITEKSMAEVGRGKFTFLVNRTATKDNIKKAIESQFSVIVTSISLVTMKGKTMRTGKRRTEVKIPAMKKAIVTLKKGEKIALFDIATK